jgi:hypothetical protein
MHTELLRVSLHCLKNLLLLLLLTLLLLVAAVVVILQQQLLAMHLQLLRYG